MIPDAGATLQPEGARPRGGRLGRARGPRRGVVPRPARTGTPGRGTRKGKRLRAVSRRKNWPRGSPRSWRRSARRGSTRPGCGQCSRPWTAPPLASGLGPRSGSAGGGSWRPSARCSTPCPAPWMTPAPSSMPSARSAILAPSRPSGSYAARKLLSRRRSAVEALRNLADRRGASPRRLAQAQEQLPAPVRTAFDAIPPQDESAGAARGAGPGRPGTRRPAPGPGPRYALRDRHAGRDRRGPRGAGRAPNSPGPTSGDISRASTSGPSSATTPSCSAG